MKYAIRDADDVLITIFDAERLASAVIIKHQFQRQFSEQLGRDVILTVAEATPRDFRAVPAGVFVSK